MAGIPVQCTGEQGESILVSIGVGWDRSRRTTSNPGAAIKMSFWVGGWSFRLADGMRMFLGCFFFVFRRKWIRAQGKALE